MLYRFTGTVRELRIILNEMVNNPELIAMEELYQENLRKQQHNR